MEFWFRDRTFILLSLNSDPQWTMGKCYWMVLLCCFTSLRFTYFKSGWLTFNQSLNKLCLPDASTINVQVSIINIGSWKRSTLSVSVMVWLFKILVIFTTKTRLISIVYYQWVWRNISIIAVFKEDFWVVPQYLRKKIDIWTLKIHKRLTQRDSINFEIFPGYILL